MKKGWLRNVVLVAQTLFFLEEFLMAIQMVTRETFYGFLCPTSHSLHIIAIPVLGYVYIREQSIER
jgi:hypothetical protein